MNKYEELQEAHQRLLDRSEEVKDPKEILDLVQAYIEQIKIDAVFVSDPRERNQLRANLRYWASFMYDQTGSYPNTTLRPASVPSTTPEEAQQAEKPENRRFIIVAGVIGGVMLLSLICLALYALVIAPQRQDDQATQVALVNAQNTQVAIAAEETALAAKFTPTSTVTPTATASPTATPSPTFVAIASPTFTLTASPTPDTSGGELFMSASLVSSGIPAEECGYRTLTITINPIELLSDLDLIAQVELSQGGDVIATGPLPFQIGIADFILLDNTSDAAVMVQVDQPLFLFDTVIAQFYSDCSRNQLTLNYQAEFTEELLPDLDEETTETTTPDLQLSWRLVTWGPSPDKEFWIATLLLDAIGGDGNYIYWATGDAANSQEDGLLLDDQLFVSKEFCDPAQLKLGVTSAGKTIQRDMVLQAPDCIEVISTPVP